MTREKKRRQGPDEVEIVLRASGWWQSDDGWRHKELFFGWPTEVAMRLQLEADRLGSFDKACATSDER